jgi:hypothetical protein
LWVKEDFEELLPVGSQERVSAVQEFFKEIGVKHFTKIIKRSPNLLSLNLESKVVPRYQWLLENGFSEAEVAVMLERFPCLLGLTVELLEKKLKYLLGLDRTHAELAVFPMALGCSLKNRLVPRLEFLASKGQRRALSSALGPTDAVYCEFLGVELAEYQTFKQNCIANFAENSDFVDGHSCVEELIMDRIGHESD